MVSGGKKNGKPNGGIVAIGPAGQQTVGGYDLSKSSRLNFQLASGMYVLKVSGERNSATSKLIIDNN